MAFLLDVMEADALGYGLYGFVGFGCWYLYGSTILANPIVHAVVTSRLWQYVSSLT